MLYSSFSKRSFRTRYLASVFFAMLLLFLGCGKDPFAVCLEEKNKKIQNNSQKTQEESLAYWQKTIKESRDRETVCQNERRSEKKQSENKQREQSEQISLWKKKHEGCSGQLIICNGNHSTCANDLKKEKEKCIQALKKEKAAAEKKSKNEEILKGACQNSLTNCESSFGSYRTTHPSKKEDCDPKNPKGTVGKIVATLRKQINGLNNNVTTLTRAKKTAEDNITNCTEDKKQLSIDKQACETSKQKLSTEKKQLTQAIQKCEGEKASWRKRAEQCGSGVSNCGNQLKTCEKDKTQLSIEKQACNNVKQKLSSEKERLEIKIQTLTEGKFEQKYAECKRLGLKVDIDLKQRTRELEKQKQELEKQKLEKQKQELEKQKQKQELEKQKQAILEKYNSEKRSIEDEKNSMRTSFLASRKKELEQTQTILQQRLQKTSIIKEDASEKEKEKNKAEKDRITTRLEVVKKEIAKISTRPDIHPMIQHSDFWIDREEVTVRAFRQCQKPDCKQRLERSASPRCNMQEHQPIVCVAYQEAQTYCRSVGKRLCSREEWLEAANFLPGGWDASIEKASNPMYTPTDKGVLGMLNHIGEWVAYSNRGGYCAWIGRSNLDKELLEEECGNKDLEFVGFRCCKNN